MITLNDWFSKHAKRPLAAAVVSAFLFWLFSLFAVTLLQIRERDVLINQLSSAISIAFTQKNRVALESLINSAAVTIKLNKIAICKGHDLIIGLNASFDECRNQQLTTIFTIPGAEDIVVSGSYKSIFSSGLVWITGIFGLGFVLVSSLIIRSTQRSLANGLLRPVQEGFLIGNRLTIVEFEELRAKLEWAKNTEKEKAVTEAIELRNKQIAHDIRSPLSALNIVAESLASESQDKAQLLRNVVARINGIAGDLLVESKKGFRTIKENPLPPKLKLESQKALNYSATVKELINEISDIVAEKQIEYSDSNKISIMTNLEKLFEKIDTNERVYFDGVELKRVLSNMINNSIEASDKEGCLISIDLQTDSSAIILSVTDNGHGIPESILNQLGSTQVTSKFQSEYSGNGLGVFHAKNAIESWNGSLNITSTLGGGSRFEIILSIVG